MVLHSAGSLALLLAALDSSASMSVLEVLHKIVLSDWLPAQQRSATALLLFQMQGATRCSAWLCPWVTRAEVLGLPGHADGTEHLAGNWQGSCGRPIGGIEGFLLTHSHAVVHGHLFSIIVAANANNQNFN